MLASSERKSFSPSELASDLKDVSLSTVTLSALPKTRSVPLIFDQPHKLIGRRRNRPLRRTRVGRRVGPTAVSRHQPWLASLLCDPILARQHQFPLQPVLLLQQPLLLLEEPLALREEPLALWSSL